MYILVDCICTWCIQYPYNIGFYIEKSKLLMIGLSQMLQIVMLKESSTFQHILRTINLNCIYMPSSASAVPVLSNLFVVFLLFTFRLVSLSLLALLLYYIVYRCRSVCLSVCLSACLDLINYYMDPYGNCLSLSFKTCKYRK